MIVVIYKDGTRLAEKVVVASNFWARFRGLLGRKGLAEGEGLLISPCTSIHCFGMKFAIDAIFLDKQYQVVAVHSNLQPGSVASDRKAKYVLELNAGEAEKQNIKAGDRLDIQYV